MSSNLPDADSQTAPIRAIIYGVGRLNLLATRLMIEKGVQVVGAINRAGPKIGQDLGVLAGMGPIGVTVLDEPERVLSTPADIAMLGVHDDLERSLPMLEACAEHGLNVINFGAHASYPWRMTPEPSRVLDAVAKRHGVTLTGGGNQDFFMISLGTLMTGVCHRLDRLIHRSLTNVNQFGREVAEIAHVGEQVSSLDSSAGEPAPSVYTTFWDNVGATLGLEITDIEQTIVPVVATAEVHCTSMGTVVAPGTLRGVTQRLDVRTREGIEMLGENTLAVFESDETEYKEWRVEGEPTFTVRATDINSGFTTASSAVNRITHVVQARPGYVTLEQLPMLSYRAKL